MPIEAESLADRITAWRTEATRVIGTRILGCLETAVAGKDRSAIDSHEMPVDAITSTPSRAGWRQSAARRGEGTRRTAPVGYPRPAHDIVVVMLRVATLVFGVPPPLRLLRLDPTGALALSDPYAPDVGVLDAHIA